VICTKCRQDVTHLDSLNVANNRMCVRCAYQIFPDGSPGRKQLELHYDLGLDNDKQLSLFEGRDLND